MKKIFIVLMASLLFSVVAFSAEASLSLNESFVFNDDGTVTVYGSSLSEAGEYGILLCEDETAVPTLENSAKYPAFGKNENGAFGVRLTYEKLVFDGCFSIRAYALTDGNISYSENSTVLDWNGYYSRVPVLSELSASEGTIYPSYNRNTFQYALLYEENTDILPEIIAKAENSEDKVTVTMPSDVSGDIKITVDSGFATSEYTISLRVKRSAKLPAVGFLIKDKASESLPYAPAEAYESIELKKDTYALVSFNTDALPEKFVPVSTSVNVSATGVRVYRVEVPEWESREDGSFISGYIPQMKYLGLSGSPVDENEFFAKSKISVALSSDEAISVTPGVTFDISYYEDIDMPVFKKDSSSSLAAYIGSVGANEIYPVFDKNVFEYYAVYEKLPEVLPEVIALPENSGAKAEITYGENEAVVDIISEDGTSSGKYTIKFREYKSATMPLTHIAAKRSPFELFSMSFPRTERLPYYNYPGRVENFGYSDYTHFTALAFDTTAVTDSDIRISSAELEFSASTNCKKEMGLVIRRILNTDWPGNSAQMGYFYVWNSHVACGLEGKLNRETFIQRTSGYTYPDAYRYYSVPLETKGFTDAKSVNLSFEGVWMEDGVASGLQIIYLWLGRYGNATENGMTMLPEVDIKYFVK